MNYTKEQSCELFMLALCCWREARNQGLIGMSAVAWTVRNRVLNPSWWGTGWIDVILKPYQYSSFNQNDPNVSKLPKDPHVDPDFLLALQAADQVYQGLGDDPTDGATHYYSTTIAEPQWVGHATYTVQIGAHRFYRAD